MKLINNLMLGLGLTTILISCPVMISRGNNSDINDSDILKVCENAYGILGLICGHQSLKNH